MIRYEKLQNKAKQFQAFAGVSVAQFRELIEAVVLVYAEIEHERLSRPKRKRKIGGGRNDDLRSRKERNLD